MQHLNLKQMHWTNRLSCTRLSRKKMAMTFLNLQPQQCRKSATVVEPTQDSADNDHEMEAEKLNDETAKAKDEEKLAVSEPKIETESKLLKDFIPSDPHGDSKHPSRI